MPARVLTTLDELDAVADLWPDDAATAPAQRFAWVRACAESLAEDLHVVALDDLRAVAPLTRRAGALELLGARDLYEPCDFAYVDDEALEELTGELLDLKRPIVVHRTWADGPVEKTLRRALRGRGLVFRREAGETPVLDLAGRSVEDRFNARRRGDIRRARRRAEELGSVAVDVVSPAPADVAPLLDEIVAVEGAGWKGVRGTALSHDPKRRRFFDEYGSLAAAEGMLRIARLRIGDETAAVQFAVEHARRLWLLKIGYDERFARCSPGTLLMLEAARWASEAGLEAIELLGVREEWTRFWTEDGRRCVALYAYPAGLGGARSLVAGGLAQGRRRAVRGIVDRAARAHLAGPGLDDALEAASKAARPVALAYWDGPGDSPSLVESISLVALERLAESGLDAYLSIKPPALANSPRRVATILQAAEELGLAVHFDSTSLDDAEPSWQLLRALARPSLGCTLPSRWGRSLADATRAVDLGLRVRIVKGQWPDPDFKARDERERFLDIVEAVAEADHVAIATHDRTLAVSATRRLDQAEHERLFGLPWRGEDVGPTRIYIPFGHAHLPYAIARVREHPRLALWVARDVIRGGRRPTSL